MWLPNLVLVNNSDPLIIPLLISYERVHCLWKFSGKLEGTIWANDTLTNTQNKTTHLMGVG